MSKIAINVDTETKSLVVNIDGQNIPNVCAIDVYETEGEEEGSKGLNVGISVCEESGNISKSTRYFVKGSINAKKESAIAGLCYGPDKVRLDIAEFFAKKRG